MHTSFAESVIFEEMMYVTNRGVRSLAKVTCFVYHVVYLSRDGLTHDAKNTTFPWRFEVYWSRLHGITWNVYLLREVKRVMHSSVKRAGFVMLIQSNCVLHDFKIVLRFLAGIPVEFSFILYMVQVFLLNLNSL